jgi:lipid-A-disaccharide synthase
MRVFLSTGEASGDMLAAALVTAIRELVPDATFGGIGSERMEAAGVTLTTRTTGWSSMGPLEALLRIAPLAVVALRHSFWLRRSPWDLIVLIDFGAFNLRLAGYLRWIGYRAPILYLLPPGAWIDSPKVARLVARRAVALTAFAHQRDFYRSLGLEIAYFGHPLVSLVAPREPRPLAPADAGTIALLPGSRRGEIERHMPALIAAARAVRERRPNARFIVSAADGEADALVRRALGVAPLGGVEIVRGARPALDAADAAWIASGTAVLEAALREVPCVALYIITEAQVPIAKRMWRLKYATLPNILLDREAVPELLQHDATPDRLARALEALLADPESQLRDMRTLRAQLGLPDALARCAAFAVGVAHPRELER